MLDPNDAVLMLINANQGQIDGRTTIQKLMYFAQLLAPFSRKLEFRPHYYGPYSAELDQLLYSLVSLRFVRSESVLTSRQRMMYSYSLAEDGRAVATRLMRRKGSEKILEVLRTCKSVTGLNPDVLSYAAKAHHILSQRKTGYTESEAIAQGRKFGWRLTEAQVRSGVKVLLDLGLAARRKPGK